MAPKARRGLGGAPIYIGNSTRRNRVVEKLYAIAAKAGLDNPLGRALYVANRQRNGDRRQGGTMSYVEDIRLYGVDAVMYADLHASEKRWSLMFMEQPGLSHIYIERDQVADLPLDQIMLVGWPRRPTPRRKLLRYLRKCRVSTAQRWQDHYYRGGSLKSLGMSQDEWLAFRRAEDARRRETYKKIRESK